MAGRPSNRDRIARAALEAEAAAKEKSSAKKASPTGSPAKKASGKKPAGRTRVVWLLCDQAGRSVKSYLYPEEQQARTDAEKLTAETGKPHFVSRGEEPFE